ncbi:MAG: leucine-rich repeat domain-containing protein [Mogibacterium sp.]|nr:leucine-rich repeat domain-containing protein [Mogibacterium sp.]
MSVRIVGEELIRFDDAAVHYAVPQHILSIADHAFGGCGGLESLECPETMKRIGNYAFEGCSGMKKIRLPDRVESLGTGLFRHCWQLRSVRFPEGLERLGAEMFESCNALQEIFLPESLKEIERSAFAGCRNLRHLVIRPGLFERLPASARSIAAITWMDRGASGESPEVLHPYIAGKAGILMDLAINRNDLEAAQYMIRHRLIPEDVLEDCLRRANRRRRVEITASLLNRIREFRRAEDPDDLLDADPFTD